MRSRPATLDAARTILRDKLGAEDRATVTAALNDALADATRAQARAEVIARKVAALEDQADGLVAQVVTEEARANRAERQSRELAERVVRLIGLIRMGIDEDKNPKRWRARARAEMEGQ